MPKPTRRRRPPNPPVRARLGTPAAGRIHRGWWVWVGAVALSLAVPGIVFVGRNRLASSLKLESVPPRAAYQERPVGSLTYSRDIAPITLQRCAPCHRAGESAPFSLTTYAEVAAHVGDLVEVINSGYMPPWLPRHESGIFKGDRSLSLEQIGLLRQWVREGAPQGNPADLPPMPDWTDGWQLGTPDLILTPQSAYLLPATGKDVYHNLVIPLPPGPRRIVRAVEFRPGNPRVVHHAFLNVDETPQSRILGQNRQPSGFDGMELPSTAQMPGGQLLGWQPGKVPSLLPLGLGWVLAPGTDIVLQLHLHPSGRTEAVQPSIGLYFTDQVPTNIPFRINLVRYDLDIPADEREHVVEQSYVLPVPVHLLAISPHAHYLARKMEGYAETAEGTRDWLLRIDEWDFAWQGDYQLSEAKLLPRGTRLVMRYTYDNSSNNVRNPNQPPARVLYGLQTTDEMAELWLQVLPANASDRDTLAKDFGAHLLGWGVESLMARLAADPRNVSLRQRAAAAYHAVGRVQEAVGHLRTAVQLEPGNARAHFDLGTMLVMQQAFAEARVEFEAVVRINPEDGEACGSLGYLHFVQKHFAEARFWVDRALAIHPGDEVAGRLRKQIGSARP